jgi:hypothetical protein
VAHFAPSAAPLAQTSEIRTSLSAQDAVSTPIRVRKAGAAESPFGPAGPGEPSGPCAPAEPGTPRGERSERSQGRSRQLCIRKQPSCCAAENGSKAPNTMSVRSVLLWICTKSTTLTAFQCAAIRNQRPAADLFGCEYSP